MSQHRYENTPQIRSAAAWSTASPAELSDALMTSLLLESVPVGVRIIRGAEEFAQCDFPSPQVPLHYCSAVKMAGDGTSLKLDRADMSCDTSPRTLGLEPGFMDRDFIQSYVASGLYSNYSRAEEVLSEVAILDDVTGVALGPLEAFAEDTPPDVVIIPSLPYAAMRLAQAASFGGHKVRSSVIGMHGICSECTAAPVATGEICTSLLCSGTRHVAGWDDKLVSTGIPFELLAAVVDGLMSTAERYEGDDRKAEMRNSCSCKAQPADRVAREVHALSDKTAYFYGHGEQDAEGSSAE